MNPYEGKPRPFARAAARLAFLLAIAGLWYRRDALLEKVRVAKAGFEAEVAKVQNQGARAAPAPSDGAVPSPGAVASGNPVPVGGFGSTSAAGPADGPASGGASVVLAPAPSAAPAAVRVAPVVPAIARRPPPPDEPLGTTRRLYGVVYDLATAAPVGGATMKFKSAVGVEWSVTTNSEGSYTLDVDRMVMDSGLLVTIEAVGYREGQIEDAEPPYRERTPEKRREALSEVAPSDLDPVPLRARANDKVVPFDFVLVPESRAR